MKNLFLILIFILITMTSLSVVKIGVFPGLPLIGWEGENPIGIYPDLIKEIAELENWEIEYVKGEFEELYNKLLNREIDILPGVVYSPERAKLLDFNQEHILSSYGTVYVPIESKFNSLLELEKKNIAVAKKAINYIGIFGIKTIFESLNIEVTYIEKNNYEEVLQSVANGEAEAGVVDSMFAALNAHNYSIKSTPIVLNPSDIRLAFVPGTEKSQSLIAGFDEQVRAMKDDPKSFFYRNNEKYLHNKEFVDNPLLTQILIVISISALILFGGILYLRHNVKIRTFEIEEKNAKLNVVESKVKKTYTELKIANERLKDTLDKFEDMVLIAGALGVRDLNEKDFLDLFLEKTMDIIDEADYGSISMIKNGVWKFVSTVGYDLNLLSQLTLKIDKMHLMKTVEIVDDLYDRYDEDFSKSDAKILRQAVKPFKQSLISPFYIEGEFVGNLSLDISKSSGHVFSEETKAILNSISKIAASFLELKQNAKNKEEFQTNVILSLVKAIEYYDIYTRGHSERVAAYSTFLAEKIGLSKKIINKIYWASLVHDVGKIFIARSVLNKTTFLTPEEFDEIKKHSEKGEGILKETKGMSEISKIVRYHHERWDGTGYPDGLKEEQIPLESRIISLGDSFDAMTSDRTYRRRMSYEDAIEDIKKYSGTLYETSLVNAFLCKDLQNLYHQLKQNN
ncbi:MAG: HD domain-containing phosphohydrolase [Thermotogota bacterium]